ncbi:HTH domain-containing protein [Anaerosporobacter sp.]|uniref:HTH domain-containing protein n=1 Tax=Anaerosporobacter sp. TaxID=1872529 RepID=UPI00286F4C4A|nr:HTH domain-containing protein [Anaerosporobacter sp.]
MAKSFSEKEKKVLMSNLYTLSVSDKTLKFTKEFKELFWNKYKNGQYPKQILTELGYDLDILGEARVVSIYQHIKRQALSSAGFREQKLKPTPKTKKSDLSNQISDQALLRMQHELLYMRQELDFIKKITKTDKPEKSDQ